MKTVKIRDEYIKLSQVLKLSSLVDSGAVAKAVIEEGKVKVNGMVELRKGRKMRAGDYFTYQGEEVKVEN